MSRCGQELCDFRPCPDCGNDEGMQHDPWDGWLCDICDWQENPL